MVAEIAAVETTRRKCSLDCPSDCQRPTREDSQYSESVLIFISNSYQSGLCANYPLSVPIVAPSVLVLTKIKRWSTLAESTRPQSIKKADSDIDDIEVLLKWLARNQLHIDFEGYLAKPKEELLSGVRKLYQMHAAFQPLLETTLDEESFALINN